MNEKGILLSLEKNRWEGGETAPKFSQVQFRLCLMDSILFIITWQMWPISILWFKGSTAEPYLWPLAFWTTHAQTHTHARFVLQGLSGQISYTYIDTEVMSANIGYSSQIWASLKGITVLQYLNTLLFNIHTKSRVKNIHFEYKWSLFKHCLVLEVGRCVLNYSMTLTLGIWVLIQGIGVFGMLLVAFKGTLGQIILSVVIYNSRYDGKGFCFTAYWCLLKGVKESFMMIQRETGTWGKNPAQVH